MSKRNWIKSKRAGSLPRCYGPSCDFCPNKCKFYDEWQEDKLREKNEAMLAKLKSQIDNELYRTAN